MVNLNKISMAMLASLALFIYGCGGGGGGGGGNNAPGTAAKSATASSKAIISALDAATAGTNPSVSGKPFLKAQKLNTSDAAQVRQALKNFKASLSIQQQKMLEESQDTGILPCNGGGTKHIQSDDNDTLNDFTDDSFSQTYLNCTENFGSETPNDPTDDGSFFSNGSLIVTPTANGYNTVFNDVTFRISFASFGSSESLMDGTMSFSGIEVSCGGETFFSTGNFAMDFSSTTKLDLDNNQIFEVNQSSSMINFSMTFSENVGPEPECASGTATFTMNGATTLTDHANAENSFSATFDDFEMTLTPAVRDGVEGELLSLTGTITVTSDCASGTFTISTPEGQEPFIPEDGSCPVDGRILVTNGGSTTAVIFTSTGGVQIDEGNNGSIDQTFDSCEESEACSST